MDTWWIMHTGCVSHGQAMDMARGRARRFKCRQVVRVCQHRAHPQCWVVVDAA